jgi:hypothetical protein
VLPKLGYSQKIPGSSCSNLYLSLGRKRILKICCTIFIIFKANLFNFEVRIGPEIPIIGPALKLEMKETKKYHPVV